MASSVTFTCRQGLFDLDPAQIVENPNDVCCCRPITSSGEENSFLATRVDKVSQEIVGPLSSLRDTENKLRETEALLEKYKEAVAKLREMTRLQNEKFDYQENKISSLEEEGSQLKKESSQQREEINQLKREFLN